MPQPPLLAHKFGYRKKLIPSTQIIVKYDGWGDGKQLLIMAIQLAAQYD